MQQIFIPAPFRGNTFNFEHHGQAEELQLIGVCHAN